MKAKNKKIKFISALVVILIITPIVLFSRPKQANAFLGILDYTITELGPITMTQLHAELAPPAIVAAPHLTASVIAKIILGIQTGSTVVNTGHVITTALIEIAKQAVMIVERRLLQEMTKSITGWINNGFHGSPLFLTNPDSFFHDIAKTEIKTLVNEFGYDPARFPFGQAFALNTINAYKRAADADTAYSLSAVMTDPVMLRNYQNNFNTGGWNGFLINTQYPQNNYLGFQMLATDKLARQLQGTTQNAAQKITTTLNQGMGFLSPQKCMDPNTKYNDVMLNQFQRPDLSQANTDYQKTHPYPDNDCSAEQSFVDQNHCAGTNGTDPVCSSALSTLNLCNQNKTAAITKYTTDSNTFFADWTSKNTCKNLVNTTPGSVAANQIFKALGSSIDKSTLGAMVEGSVASILDTLVSHFLDQGLNALGSTINGTSGPDTFSYKGNTLVTNSAVGTNTGATFSFSQPSVSVYPGTVVNNITISGGTPPYTLLGNCDNGGAGSTPNITQANCMTTTSGAGTWNPGNSQFAIVYASDVGITVIGVAAGNTSIVVQDSSSPAKTIVLPITVGAVAPPAAPVADQTGICNYGNGADPIPGTTKSACEGSNGTWSGTSTPPPADPMGDCDTTDGRLAPIPARQSDCETLGGNWSLTLSSTTTDSLLGTCTVNSPTDTVTGIATKSTCDAQAGGVWTAN